MKSNLMRVPCITPEKLKKTTNSLTWITLYYPCTDLGILAVVVQQFAGWTHAKDSRFAQADV